MTEDWLDFKIDRVSLTALPVDDLHGVDWGVLSHLYFEMPVTMIVGGETLFEDASIPIIHLAFDALSALEDLENDKEWWVTLPGTSLILLREGTDIIVTFEHKRTTGRTAYSKLLKVWREFSDRVRAFLLEEFPEFGKHPQLGRWFREGYIPRLGKD